MYTNSSKPQGFQVNWPTTNRGASKGRTANSNTKMAPIKFNQPNPPEAVVRPWQSPDIPTYSAPVPYGVGTYNPMNPGPYLDRLHAIRQNMNPAGYDPMYYARMTTHPNDVWQIPWNPEWIQARLAAYQPKIDQIRATRPVPIPGTPPGMPPGIGSISPPEPGLPPMSPNPAFTGYGYAGNQGPSAPADPTWGSVGGFTPSQGSSGNFAFTGADAFAANQPSISSLYGIRPENRLNYLLNRLNLL